MTAASNEVVAVIQADRDMAQKTQENLTGYRGTAIRDGEMDSHWLVQSYAAHRIAHSDPRPVAEGLREALEPFLHAAEPIIHNDRERWQPDEWTARWRLITVGQFRALHAAVLATHSPAPMAGADEWVRLAFVTGFEQAKHNDSLTAEQFYDEWAHAGFPAATDPSTQEGGAE